MVIKRIQASLMVAALGAIVASVLTGPVSFAATSVSDNSNTLKISPVRSDITINPGQSQTLPLYVTNVTKSPITLSPIENDFIAGDEKGTPALILDATKYAPTHSLKRFMTPLANVTVAPGKTAVVNATITVPKDAQAGGYFGAVRFAPASDTTGGQVNLNASAASIILLTVPGKIVEKLQLTNFEVQQNGRTNSNFMSGQNLQVFTRFENQGGIQEGPTGLVYVKSGDKVVYRAPFNTSDPRDMILPDSARRWTVPLKNVNSFGYYTVGATFTYGKDNQTIDVTTSFWVVPLWVILTAAGGVLLLIVAILVTWLLIRRHKKRMTRGRARVNGYRR